MNTFLKFFLLSTILTVEAGPCIAQNLTASLSDYAYNSTFAPLLRHELLVADTLLRPQLSQRQQRDRKLGRTLGYIGIGMFFATPFLIRADKDVGTTAFWTGVALAPPALYFAIRSRKL